jgi:hypothetical protein
MTREPTRFEKLRAAANERSAEDNLEHALAAAMVQSSRARDRGDSAAYFAWNRVIQQLWAIEQATTQEGA